MPRRFPIRKETKALGAAQIMISLILYAFGVLWIFLHSLEEKSNSVGSTLMMILIFYSCGSAIFFMNSGAWSVIQKPYTLCKVITAIVMNVLSICVATLGLIMLVVEFVAFEEMSDEYTWSNMCGMLLVHFTIFCTITELILASVLAHWFKTSLRKEQYSQERSLSSTEYSYSSVTP
ncbi:uncharacterized protein LOC131480166 isoform X1 [Ochotona princeps]|uniref:uncharacterized protein LOC131480166 isoform X1 n=1 Tax=Ochotona princeps TaxID=9978 RepID=UPI00271472A3|nr:uncharacterized protein LOC131480166 isoform X1 [Ochotona princeps]XP_058518967.1 uncharacterized protein LOC131480166 isoform X1 [Ochotona princeps]